MRLVGYDRHMNNHPGKNSTVDTGILNTILVSNPGIRRDSLLALLQSVPDIEPVIIAGTFEECERAIPGNEPILVVVDHAANGVQPEQTISMIRQKNSKAWIVLLVSHPRDTFAFSISRPDSILCDGFSSASLLEEIQKALPMHARV
jgi:DNA-binding NarL/FixJ family response regulator